MTSELRLGPSQVSIEKALAELAASFGNRLVTSQAVRAQHANVTTWSHEGIPDGVVFPQSVAEVQKAVQICVRHGVPMIPYGAGSSLEGHLNAPFGGISFDMKDFAAARTAFTAAIAGGYGENDIDYLLAEANLSDNMIPEGMRLLQVAIDKKGAAAPEDWLRRGMVVSYKSKSADYSNTFGTRLVSLYPSTENWSLVIAVLRDLANFQSQESIDLLRLMERTKSFSEARDYVEYIQAADPRRLPGEVIKILDEGLAAGKLDPKDVFVSDDEQLMPRGIYFKGAQTWPAMFFTLSPTYLGVANAIYDFTVSYLRGEWPGEPPVKRRMYPTKQIAVAQMRIQLEQMRSLFLRAVLEARPNPSKDERMRLYAAHYTVMEGVNDLARMAIRTCGGQSMMKHLPLERLYRDSRCGALMLPWTAELVLDRMGRETLYEAGERDD